MANTLYATFDVGASWLLEESDDLDAPKVSSYRRFLQQFQPGSGSGQVTKLFRDSRSLSASASETLDLSALVENVLAETRVISFTTVRGIMVIATSTPADAVLTITTVGTSDGFDSLFGGAAGSTRLGPGDVFAWTRRLAGAGVDSGNKDLKFTNDDADAAATYDVVIVGT